MIERSAHLCIGAAGILLGVLAGCDGAEGDILAHVCGREVEQNDLGLCRDAPDVPAEALPPVLLGGMARFTEVDRTDCYAFHLDGAQGIQLDITPEHATQDLAVNFFWPDGSRGACGGTCSGGSQDGAPYCTGTTIRYTYSNWIPGDYEVCLGDGEGLIASACKSIHAPVGPYRLDVSFYDAPGGGSGFSTGFGD